MHKLIAMVERVARINRRTVLVIGEKTGAGQGNDRTAPSHSIFPPRVPIYRQSMPDASPHYSPESASSATEKARLPQWRRQR